MRSLRELTLEGNEALEELPDLSFFPALQVLRVPASKRYPIPRCIAHFFSNRINMQGGYVDADRGSYEQRCASWWR